MRFGCVATDGTEETLYSAEATPQVVSCDITCRVANCTEGNEMSTTSLIAEFFVIGIVPLFAILFTILLLFRVYDLDFLSPVKEFFPLLAIAAALSAYLLGAVTQRLGQRLNTQTMKFLFRFRIVRTALRQSEPTDLEDWRNRIILIEQFGSDAVTERLTRSWDLTRIFKATALTLPLLAFPLSIWLGGRAGWQCALIAFLVCILLATVASVSFLIERREHRHFVRIATRLIGKSETLGWFIKL